MTANQSALESERPRGSARLLACWESEAGGPLDGVTASLVADERDDPARWGRILRRHGARPSRPQALTDGVPLTELVVRGAPPATAAVTAAREAARLAAHATAARGSAPRAARGPAASQAGSFAGSGAARV